jgi:hypothetical protein
MISIEVPTSSVHNSSVHFKEKMDKLTVSVFIAEEQLRVAVSFFPLQACWSS